jgi:hypothetical protein
VSDDEPPTLPPPVDSSTVTLFAFAFDSESKTVTSCPTGESSFNVTPTALLEVSA